MNKKEKIIKEIITPEFLDDGRIMFNSFSIFENQQKEVKLKKIKRGDKKCG